MFVLGVDVSPDLRRSVSSFLWGPAGLYHLILGFRTLLSRS